MPHGSKTVEIRFWSFPGNLLGFTFLHLSLLLVLMRCRGRGFSPAAPRRCRRPHSAGTPRNAPIRDCARLRPAGSLGAGSRSPLNPAFPAENDCFRSPWEVRLSGVSPSQSAFLVCWGLDPRLRVLREIAPNGVRPTESECSLWVGRSSSI